MGGFSGVLARMIRTDPRTPDAVAEYAPSVGPPIGPFHRPLPGCTIPLELDTRNGSATLQVQCAIYSTGRNYRTNKQLIEGIFGGWFYERSCEPKTIEAHRGWRDFASNTHLRGDVRCRALLRGVKSAVAKTLLSMPDLRYRALAAIRKQSGCSNIHGIAINLGSAR